MNSEKFKPYFKWGYYYLLLLVLFLLQNTPDLFKVFGVKPVLILPLMVCVCVFEEAIPSTVFAMFTGLLWDMSSSKLMGFNAIILVTGGVFISLLCIYYLHTKLINTVIFCAIMLLIQGSLDYFFYFELWGLEGRQLIFLTEILPTAAYSLLTVFPLYFIIKKISYKFNVIVRV